MVTRVRTPRAAPARPGGAGRLEVDSLALAVATGATGVIGIAFWAAAARGYPAAEVGRASALLSASTAISSVAMLSIGGLYERFLPVAGRRAPRMVALGLGLTVPAALLLGAAYVALEPTGELLLSGWEGLVFTAGVAVLTVFTLLDHLLTGMFLARVAAVKNVVHAVAKLGLLPVLAVTGSGFAVVVAWVAPAAVLAVLVLVIVVRPVLRGPRFAAEPRLPSRPEIGRYVAGTYGITVIAQLTPLVLPLVIVARLGTTQNAYFTIAWTLVSACVLIVYQLAGPFIARAAAATDARVLLRRYLVLIAAVAGAGTVGLVGVAPWLITFLGGGYEAESVRLVRVMGLALPFVAVAVVFMSLSRVVRRLRLPLLVEGARAVLLVGGAWVLGATGGLVGVAVAYLATEAVIAVVVAVPAWRLVREVRRGAVA